LPKNSPHLIAAALLIKKLKDFDTTARLKQGSVVCFAEASNLI
jgi:hypothetical protein